MAWKLIKVFTLATIVAVCVRFFFIEDFRVVSDSMTPSLLPGDLVFISKSAYSLYIPFSNYEWFHVRRPKAFEIAAFNLPASNPDSFVKRVVALAGDRVEIRKGILKINGMAATYAPIKNGYAANAFLENWGQKSYPILWTPEKIPDYGPVDVPTNHFFALGDNRNNSLDSRSWGPVPYTCLKGKVGLVWASLDERGGFRPKRTGTWIQ